MSIYQGPLSKEDFKTALVECEKKAWVWHSFANFKQMLDAQNAKEFIYWGKDKITNEDDYHSDASTIDLYEVYCQLLDNNNQQDNESLTKFSQNWTDEDGFVLTKFQGETIENGNEVGDKARVFWTLENAKKTPHLKVADFSGNLDFVAVQKQTTDLLNNEQSQYHYLFEPAFGYDNNNLKTRCDILRLNGNNHVEIIEIKATSKIKPEHFFDLAYQIFILEKNGLIVDEVYLGHLRDNFILGVPFAYDDSPLKDLASTLYEETPQITFAEAKTAFEKVLNSNWQPDSEIKMIEDEFDYFLDFDPWLKKQGSKTAPYSLLEAYRDLETQGRWESWINELSTYLNKPLSLMTYYFQQPNCSWPVALKQKKGAKIWAPKETFCYHIMPWFDTSQPHIFQLTGSSNFANSKKAQVYWETQQVYLTKIKSLKGLEASLTFKGDDFFLPYHHEHLDLVHQYQTNKFRITDAINGKQGYVKQNLVQYSHYPVYMYDFETVKWAIPRFHRSKSYQQIPFQYSIDVLMDDNYDYNQPQSMKHYDFLANQIADPRPEFLREFLKAIFSQGPGVYVAYNDSFEKTVLKYAAWAFPELKIPLFYIVQNTIDLMTFFKGKKGVYPWFMVNHPLFEGSYSIKKTQPALEPNFSYTDLTINKGDKASQVFREFIDGLIPQAVWEEGIYPDLLAYCNRDTLAMVVILQRVKEIYQEWEQNAK
ncbi:uncharacterized protein DUF2779 [Entomoplasma freundtii]|uniref:Uncharacterized protein n=1 Tax=Entomoplasma freundtii TaxID=74700 RepID=A0A2K8NRF6_9MOLU|nr:DUF2779 domain-containing protein [Entomoplasma freundtii]ATZ16399.1 hypothetical protein EFREU_v1c03730 [Entomoplasma freundtii]TDY56562.1 uncharacterized protein DUF2779 [Entomoplasma freundtii]